MSSGEGEEIAISVRWKRPGVRAARRLVGIATVTIGAMQLWGAEPVTRREKVMPPTLDWSCDRMPAPRVRRMTDTPNADDSRNGETGGDATVRDRNDVVRLEEHVTRRVIGVFHHVHDRLGSGKLESIYRNAMAIEFRKRGMDAVMEPAIRVWYDGEVVGLFRADFLVEGRVIVELNAGRTLDESARAQPLDYLSCSDVAVGLLLQYGPKPRFQRAVYTIDGERRPYPR